MKFYIREWSDSTIVLMTEAGYVLSFFSSVTEALSACAEWHEMNVTEKKYDVTVQYKKSAQANESTVAYA